MFRNDEVVIFLGTMYHADAKGKLGLWGLVMGGPTVEEPARTRVSQPGEASGEDGWRPLKLQ